MDGRHRVLVATQPAALSVMQTMLRGIVDMVPAHCARDAFKVLDHEAAGIGLIVSTIAFDDSRMVGFLQAVKQNPSTSAIPFLGCRVLPGVLSDHLVANMRLVCMQFGAADLLDLARLEPDAAGTALRTAVMNCLNVARAED